MQNIVLVGPVGAGKSSVGRGLATLLRRQFVDSDQEIEKRTGVDIPAKPDCAMREQFKKNLAERLKHPRVTSPRPTKGHPPC